MEDLRWILLLVGALVVVAVYFSSRFEREDWVREREQFDARKQSSKNKLKKRITKKAVGRQQPAQPSSATKNVRKEPQMTSEDFDVSSSKEPELPTTSSVTLDSDAEKNLAEPSGPLENSEIQSTTENPSYSSVEEKVVFDSRDPDGQSDIASPSMSEIPPKVILEEEVVETLGETVDSKNQRDDTDGISGVSAGDGIDGVIDAAIEDEITGVEIPADLAIAEAELQTTLHAESQQSDASDLGSAKNALPPNVEPLVLVLTVMSEDEPFSGIAVQEALEAEGLRHGEMRIFHFFDESLDASVEDNSNNVLNADSTNENALPIFSVASLVEPGYFELDKIDEMEIPGLTLFCQLPGPLSGAKAGEEAFNIMLDKGRGVAVRLHGQLCDDKRNRFTTQAKTHYQDRISTFERELSVAKKKAGI